MTKNTVDSDWQAYLGANGVNHLTKLESLADELNKKIRRNKKPKMNLKFLA